jgi:hypothetical protein
MIPLTIEPVVRVEMVRDEPIMVDRTVRVFVVRELVMSVDPIPFVKPIFAVETVEPVIVD